MSPPAAPAARAWSLSDIPDQPGRTFLVTGTTQGGLGHFTALELARRGGRVVLAGRSADKLDATEAAIRAEAPGAVLEKLVVDLADLGSVRAAATEAGGSARSTCWSTTPASWRRPTGGQPTGSSPRWRPTTSDRSSSPASSSLSWWPAVMLAWLPCRRSCTGGAPGPVGDPRAERRYQRWPVYAQTKLANLLFTFALDRRARDMALPVTALAAHPGLAGTHLAANGQFGRAQGGAASILDAAVKAISQPARAGAWPTLMAATADLPGSTYVGPSGLGEMGGSPQVVTPRALALDAEVQEQLWRVSEETVGLSWP